MLDFRNGGVNISIPNAQIIFPPLFDEQIAHVLFFFLPKNNFFFAHSPLPNQDYTKKTNDTTIRFSCVSVNVLRTDTVFDTFLNVNSAIVGVTFIVHVNGSAIVCSFLLAFFFPLSFYLTFIYCFI